MAAVSLKESQTSRNIFIKVILFSFLNTMSFASNICFLLCGAGVRVRDWRFRDQAGCWFEPPTCGTFGNSRKIGLHFPCKLGFERKSITSHFVLSTYLKKGMC